MAMKVSWSARMPHGQHRVGELPAAFPTLQQGDAVATRGEHREVVMQPGAWVTLLSGHMGDSPLLSRGPVDQGPLGSGDAESEERSDEDG
ncbi:MAG: hypothetical protein ACK58T_43390, partial [Phycisphaerae bacterium]